MESIIEKMSLIRRVEEEICERYSEQQMRCPTHLSIGQEAISVGVCHHLQKEDQVFSTHRSHAAYLAKGGSLEKMALELHGKIGGCQDGRGGSMHLNDRDANVMSIPIVASAIPLAVGAALANKMNGNGNIVVCFFGDAAVEEGIFHESMNFASLMQLPIIFVCENNQYSVDTHINKRQPKRSLAHMAMAHDMDFLHRDGNNPFNIAADLFPLIAKARRENSPCFIILDTQRSHVHCGTELEYKIKNDPVESAISMAINSDALTLPEYIKMKDKIDTLVTNVFDAAEAAPLPTPDMASKYVYA